MRAARSVGALGSARGAAARGGAFNRLSVSGVLGRPGAGERTPPARKVAGPDGEGCGTNLQAV